jgi:hypothetical protein
LIRHAIAICCLLAAPLAFATAHDTSDVNWTGSLASLNGATPKAGRLVVQPYVFYSETRNTFDNKGDRHAVTPSRSWRSIAVITYGITDRFAATVTPSVSRASSAGNSTDGIRSGDTAVRFQYMLQAPNADGTRAAFSLVAGHRFAVGRYDRLGSNGFNGGGRGAEGNNFAALYQQWFWLSSGRPLRVRANAGWAPRPGPVSLRGASVYGTGRGFIGSANPGSNVNALLAAEYSINRRWGLAMDLGWSRDSDTRVHGIDGQGFAVSSSSGPSSRWYASPAIEYHLSSSVGFIAGTEIAFAGRNSGASITPQASVVLVF